MNKKSTLDKMRFFIQSRVEKHATLFQSLNLYQLTFASVAFGILTIFFYFFSTYFPLLYLFAILFLLFKLAAFELALLQEKNHSEPCHTKMINLHKTLFEITDILLWVTIILADSHYYAIGIFVLATYWSMTAFHSINSLNALYRSLILIPASLAQLIVRQAQWKIDIFYILFCLIILTGIVSIIYYVYQLCLASASRHGNE